MSSFHDRFLEKRFGSIPSHWVKYEIGDILWERKESSSDIARYPLFSLTIEDGVTEKTEQYERSFLLKDKDSNEYRLVYPEDVVYNPMNLRFGAITVSRINKIVSVSAYYNVLGHNKEKCDIAFLDSLLNSYQLMDLYDRVAIGSLTEKRRVHLSEFIKLKVFLPPLPEQKKIAEILGTWDEVIEKTEKLIAAKQKRKKGLMQQLLTGKKRFKEFKEQKWHEVKLSDLGECIRGVSYNPEKDLKQHEDNYTVRLLRSTNIQDEDVRLDDVQYVNIDKCNDKQLALLGDILICMSNGSKPLVGKTACFRLQDTHKYTIGAFCAIFRVYPSNNIDYINQLFKSEAYKKQLSILLAGTNINNLKNSDIESLKFFVPKNKLEQSKIASVLNIMDHEIILLWKKLDVFKQQKKGLMQKLLTGKVRVKV